MLGIYLGIGPGGAAPQEIAAMNGIDTQPLSVPTVKPSTTMASPVRGSCAIKGRRRRPWSRSAPPQPRRRTAAR